MSAKAQSKIFHNQKDPGSMGGVERLCRRARQLHVPGVTRQTVQDYLKSEQTYTCYKPARGRFTRNHTYEAGIDAQWQVNLAYMQGIARQNGGMRYLLTVIDVFLMFAWAVPVHSKEARAITAAFAQVLTTAKPRHPQRLQIDKGMEFLKSDFHEVINAAVSSTLAVKASKRRPWWSDSIGPSRP